MKILPIFLLTLIISAYLLIVPCYAEDYNYWVLEYIDEQGKFSFTVTLKNGVSLKLQVQSGDEIIKYHRQLLDIQVLYGDKAYYYILTNFYISASKVLPNVLVTTKEPNGGVYQAPNVRAVIVSALDLSNNQTKLLTTYWFGTKEAPENIYTPQQQKPSGIDILGGINLVFDFFGKMGGMAGAVLDFFTKLPSMFYDALNFLGGLIGHTGNPSVLNDINSYRLQLQTLASNPQYSDLAQQALNSKIPLGRLSGLINVKPEHQTKTLKELEDSAPIGFLGFISFVWFTLTSPAFQNILAMIVKNFILINVVIICSIVVFGMVESLAKKSISPLANSIKLVKDYFLAYYKFATWLFTIAYRILQLIVQVLDAIIPF